MKIALAQINPVVGDVEFNLQAALRDIRQANEVSVDLLLLPELFLTGYPARDLLNRSDLIDENLRAKKVLVEETAKLKMAIAFGYVERTDRNGTKPLFNALCIAQDGHVLQTRYKTLLPTYDVFEEYRYFEPGPKQYDPVKIGDTMVGFVNCEEAWNDQSFWHKTLYDVDPVAEMVKSGAEYIAVINASPFRKGVSEVRRKMMGEHCRTHNVACCYVNQWGYNDEVGFDGNSFALNKDGEVIAQAMPFVEELLVFDTNYQPIAQYETPWEEEVLLALEVGIKDYYGKLNITGPAIIGLSGGIDSAIVAYLAVRALGADRVVGIGMPSEFSSDGSVTDAEKIAKKLGIHFAVQPIVVAHDDMRKGVNVINHYLTGGTKDGKGPPNPALFGRKIVLCEDSGVTDENLQARIRGMYLMAISNYYGGLVLSTGNKSEMAVGYCTLYGDMCGGLAVISDVPKTMVYHLSRYINEQLRDEIIPWNTIDKLPSAELRADQNDQQTLPPYPVLDEVLYKFVDEAKSPQQILNDMFDDAKAIEYLKQTNRMLDKDIVWVCNAVTRNEFKRKQAPTGLKISHKHFKYGWTMPTVHRLSALIPVKA